MSNAKHTPGPWKVDGSGIGVYTETGVNAAGFCPMVASTAMADVDLATARANARLIAAAPELLNTLSAYIEVTNSLGRNVPPESWFVAAKAAIAKATGSAS